LSLLREVPGYETKVYHVATETELIDKTKSAIFPVIAVLYEGIRPTYGDKGGDQRGSSGGSGTSGDLTTGVILYFRNEAMTAADSKLQFITEADRIRKSLMRQRAPTGHFWRFMGELYVSGKDGKLAIIQRWATTVQLT
jgi:hypothetical protein